MEHRKLRVASSDPVQGGLSEISLMAPHFALLFRYIQCVCVCLCVCMCVCVCVCVCAGGISCDSTRRERSLVTQCTSLPGTGSKGGRRSLDMRYIHVYIHV